MKSKKIIYIISSLAALTTIFIAGFNTASKPVFAEDHKTLPPLQLCNNEDPSKNPGSCKETVENSGKTCGEPGTDASLTPSIDLGCRGHGNGILDLIFAIVRLIGSGVGLIVIGSLIVAGIQYTSSRGDPQATANAIKRVSSTVIALLIYIFAYALLGWIIPGQLLQ